MGRRRKGMGNGHAAVEARRVEKVRNLGLVLEDSQWISWAFGTEHDSVVKPPTRVRTMEQIRMYRKPVSKNIARPFNRTARRTRPWCRITATT